MAAFPVRAVAQSRAALDHDVPWRLIARAEIIVEGRLAAPIEELEAGRVRLADGEVNADLVDLEISVSRVYKNFEHDKDQLDGSTLAIRYHPGTEDYRPTISKIVDLNGSRVVAYLVRVDNRGARSGFYFSSGGPEALSPYAETLDFAITAEVAEQQRMLALRSFVPSTPVSHEDEVKALIADILNVERAESAYQKLQSLGMDAVPAIILNMDDRRELPIQYIAVENQFPGAWETHAQYGPERVVDVLAIILGTITGERFGAIDNGGTERDRAHTVNGWRIYLGYSATGDGTFY